jgi:hypothetical protein
MSAAGCHSAIRPGPVNDLPRAGIMSTMSLLSCPHCHLAIHPRADFLAPDYCPRCLARRHRAEPMSYIAEPARPRVMHQQRDMLAPPVPPAPPAS